LSGIPDASLGEAIGNPEQAWRFEEAWIPDQAFGLSGMTVL